MAYTNIHARRANRTDLDMLASGSWNRIARKDYRHSSGIRITYRDNDWVWEIIGGARDGDRYTTLHIARHEVERALAA